MVNIETLATQLLEKYPKLTFNEALLAVCKTHLEQVEKHTAKSFGYEGSAVCTVFQMPIWTNEKFIIFALDSADSDSPSEFHYAYNANIVSDLVDEIFFENEPV